MGCLHGDISTDHQSTNRIELSHLGQNLFHFSESDMSPPTSPPIQPQVAVSLQIINIETDLNFPDLVKIYYIFSDFT